MPKRQAKEIKLTQYYKHLKRCVEERPAVDFTESVARALADMRHICDEFKVDYGVADRIGGYYYAAKAKEKEIR